MDILHSQHLPMLKKKWSPLLRMAKTDRIASELAIQSYYGRFAFAQLTHQDLPFRDTQELADRIDAKRLNWDGTYAKDLATFLSILTTNHILCKSWNDLNAIFKVYRQSWKNRFLISLFCEAISKKGYYGNPLYYSELVGYRKRFKYYDGFLDIINSAGPEGAFEWMHRSMFQKLIIDDIRNNLEADFISTNRCRVYPYLVFGSLGWAAYNRFEQLGGMNRILGPQIPEEVREEVYIMVISCFSSVIRMRDSYSQKVFSNVAKSGINNLVHFGADTSIKTSPLFAFLQGEIGHFSGDVIAKRKVKGIFGEFFDRSWMNTYLLYEGFEKSESELDFSRKWSGAPADMINCIKKDLKELPVKRAKEKYRISEDWLRKMRR